MAANVEEIRIHRRLKQMLCSKKQVTDWTQVDLERLSIFYENSAVKLEDLVSRAKNVAWKGRLDECTCTSPPAYVKEFEWLLKKSLTFSLPADSNTSPVNILEAEQDLKLINKERERFINLASEMKSKTHFTKTAELEFDFLKTRTHDFLVYLAKFQEIRATCPRNEAQYTNLFMEFSRIFSLKPEMGGIRDRQFRIGNQDVVCNPDVRYVRYPQIADHSLLVMNTETEFAETECKGENLFDIHKLSTNTLGQHGGQLLAERNVSVFRPGVVGIICLKTKLIFTFMEMTEDHYSCIERGESCEKHTAKIIYTKPLDFFIQEEREEMFSTLFWFGHLQQCT